MITHLFTNRASANSTNSALESTWAKRDNLFHSLFNLFQVPRDVFFRKAKRSTCAITGQPFTSNFTHHCRAGNTTAKLPDVVNGVLRSLALQRRASLNLLGYRLFHTLWGVAMNELC